MELFIDADACPVKEAAFKVAARHGLKVYVVSNQKKLLPKSDNLIQITVEKIFDAVDDWIALQIKPNDLVITNDILLADRCIKLGALAIDPRGKILDENNIGEALAMRELLSELRQRGDLQTGPKQMGKKHHSHFLANLDKVIHRLKKEG